VDDLAVRGWAFAAAVVYVLVAALGWRHELGFDSHAYWLVWHHRVVYGNQPNTRDAFLYSPAFAQLLWPLAQLPWQVFLALWTCAGFVAYAWLLWPLDWPWRITALLICLPQVLIGNIWPLLAVVLVYGFERAPLWSIALLTKVTAGVGIVWFAARSEWRRVAATVGVTVAVVAISAAISPHLWGDWLDLLIGGGTRGAPAGAFDVPLVYRLPVAFALTLYAARRSRRDLLAIAMIIGCPVFAVGFYFASLPILAALPRLRAKSAIAPSASSRGTRPAAPSSPAAAIN
jgi:hypothetical protein